MAKTEMAMPQAQVSLAQQIQARHCAYYLKKVQQAPEAWQQIERIYPQIERAWQQASPTVVLALIHALGTYQERRGLWTTRLEWLKRGIALRDDSVGHARERCAMLTSLGKVYFHQSQLKDKTP